MTPAAQDPRRLLSDRDRQIVALLGCGYNARELGLALGISSRTARYHVAALLRKFDVSNAKELLGLFVVLDWPFGQ